MHHQHPDTLRQMAYDHHRSTIEQARWDREVSRLPQTKKRWRLPRLKIEYERSKPELVFRIKFSS